MRSDYFTVCEFAYTVRNDVGTVKRLFRLYRDFPVKTVGTRNIIPKAQFFGWWDNHKDDQGTMFSFDVRQLEEARNKYTYFLMSKYRR